MAVLKRMVFLLALVFIFPRFITAQEKSGTRVTRKDGEFQVSQIIVFSGVPDTLRYELEFERLLDGGFVPVDTVVTEETRIEVFLNAGSYRYRISSYNRMGLLEGMSDWREFQVLAAAQPGLENYRPFYGLYFDFAESAGSITVTGSNFLPGSEFALVRHRAGFDWSGVDLAGRKGVLRPDLVTVSDDGRVELVFNRKTLRGGRYDIFVRNPGGLWATLGRVQTGFRKNNDFTVSFGYSLFIASFDYQNSLYRGYLPFHYTMYPAGISPYTTGKQKLDLFNPIGAYVRAAWLPIKTGMGNFGFETDLYFLGDNAWRHTNNGAASFFSKISAVYGSLLYQYALTERWQLNVRAGAGGSESYHYERNFFEKVYGIDYFAPWDDISEEPWGLMTNFGVSAQFFAWKNLFFEAGMDFQYMPSVYHFMMRPGIGLGWQFGRWAEAPEVKGALKRGDDPSVPVTDIIKDEYTFSVGWASMVPFYHINRRTTAKFDSSRWSVYPLPGGGLGVLPYTYEPAMTILDPFNPVSFYLRAAYIPYRWNKNRLGMEFNLYVLEHPNRETWAEGYSSLDILSAAHVDILYQRILTEPLRFNVRLGFGISNPYNIEENNDGLEIPFAMNAGVSAQYFIWKNLYAEAGLDFALSFGTRVHGIFRP
ncbi:MAG: hypothetical protein LBG42_06945, partial [Treponema sp.]|nr:hypothetical protein [Treponema sp.]